MRPTATYRPQFNKAFTFADATNLIPYFQRLGISHIYASPYLKARPGSTHGYDITDHNALNPEIGSWDEFERFCAALRASGIGQILDFVPNHMGIGHADNDLWLDVLEWGRESPFADFFDINWTPRQPILYHKVLLPFLGDQYGHVLERGELALRLDAPTGSFSIWYFDHRFPVSPRCYASILEHLAIEGGVSRSPATADLRQLTGAFADIAHPTRAAQKNLRSTVAALKESLAKLVQAEPTLAANLNAAVAAFNGQPGEPRSFEALHELLERQAYRLAFWRVAAEEINYRRFFDINELAGIRVENAAVFALTHRLLGRLIGEGKIQGLRLDHIDGLLDPAAYLCKLQKLAKECGADTTRSAADGDNDTASDQPFYVVVEKILARHERLRENWPVAGTTGYECLNWVNGLFVDPNGERPLDQIYRHFLDRPANFDEILYDSKSLVIDTLMSNELNRLSAELDDLSERHWSTRDYTQERMRSALKEIVAAYPVYRSYINETTFSPEDRRDIDWAISQARRTYSGHDPEILDFIRTALTVELPALNPAFDRSDVLRFTKRFQQYTGPIMAKALEDTSFYRYNRLLSLNEVGGDPRQFGISTAAFHRLIQERAKHHPDALSPSATHDTKRGADMRARLNVLSEIPEEWNKRARRWASLNRFKRQKTDDGVIPSRNDEYMIYQMLVGAWPATLVGVTPPDSSTLSVFRERVHDAALKAIREAKRHTSWYSPNEAYESACTTFVERILDYGRLNPFLDDFIPFQARIARLGVLNSLCQTVVTLAIPGIPDIYQGSELWDLNLMDPDNRRPVDFAVREDFLAGIERATQLPAHQRAALLRQWLESWHDGRIKLALTAALLAFRQREPTLFSRGSYEPLIFDGPHADHLFGFLRRDRGRICIVVISRFLARLTADTPEIYPGGSLWRGCTTMPQDPPKSLVNILTGGLLACGDAGIRLEEAMAELPAAVLFGQEGGTP